jgi:hypothetical protein
MPFDSHEQDDATQRLALPAPVLHRLAGSELIARGSVNVISVKAIRSWAGDWWSQKRGDVWTYVERKLAEHLDRSDMRARISDSEFLIAMNSDQGLAAQATSVRILEDVLTHLLGSVNVNDLGISSVIGVENGEAVCRRIDAGSVCWRPAPGATPTARRCGARSRRPMRPGARPWPSPRPAAPPCASTSPWNMSSACAATWPRPFASSRSSPIWAAVARRPRAPSAACPTATSPSSTRRP